MDALWLRRLDQERRLRNLTPAHELVLRAIALDLALGHPEPSEARLMSQAGVSRSTVQRAKARGRALGLLVWERRYSAAGGRRVELPCRYRLERPMAPARRLRERQLGARRVARSIEVQLAALPTPAGVWIRAWDAARGGYVRSCSP